MPDLIEWVHSIQTSLTKICVSKHWLISTMLRLVSVYNNSSFSHFCQLQLQMCAFFLVSNVRKIYWTKMCNYLKDRFIWKTKLWNRPKYKKDRFKLAKKMYWCSKYAQRSNDSDLIKMIVNCKWSISFFFFAIQSIRQPRNFTS